MEKKKVFIYNHIIKVGTKNGLSIVSHNHINGIVIPSLRDIRALILVQSKYSPIYSPNKTGLLVNTNVSENKDNRARIFNKYKKFIYDKNAKIEKLYPEETKRIRDNYRDKELEKRLNDLYRPYYVKNQEKIASEINTVFKENNYGMKLYIL